MPPLVARLALAALLLVAGAITTPEPASAGRASFRISRPTRSVAKRRAASTVSITRALARGTAIDGPRHTGRAIKKNPRVFAAGVVAIGTIGAVSHQLGWNGEHVALGLSAAAVAAQVRAAWPTLKRARGIELARRIGADVVWPVILFGASFGVGSAIHGEAAPGHAPGWRQVVTSFLSSSVIGGDAPAVGVTALDTRRSRGGN